LSCRGAQLALALCGVLGLALAPSPALAESAAHRSRREPAAGAHAPSGPPLVSGESAYAAPQSAGAGGESEPESAAASEDPLVRNGLSSPLCRLAAGELSTAAAEDCRTSGFVAASAPSEDYSFDTNIDTTFGVSIDALLQDYVVRPIWMALVWLVHALLVALEWAYSLDLLRGPLASGLGSKLRAAQAGFTQPWLASCLAVAAVLLAYHGLVRRRLAQTLGEALMMLAMIAAAMLVIADPEGTIGSLSQLADTASVGAFGAVAQGSTAHPYHALAESLQGLYAASIEAPWCFLEFGDVGWCDRLARLDPRLQKAAARIASGIEGQARAGSRSGVSAEVLAHRAQLLRSARTNGQIFLALPPNGPLRNSVKESTSLLYALCGGGEDATQCRGPTAAEAEFRANSGTLPRLGGVLLIALSLLGMLLLVGFVAMRLIEAAIFSVLLLLLAPVAALAPTLGETGRAAFQRWAGRLIGTVSAKLLWSALLAALLASLRIVLAVEGLGWLVQWLLSGALWWCVYLRRHDLLAGGGYRRGTHSVQRTRLARIGEDALVVYGIKAAKSAWRLASPKRPPREGQAPWERQRPWVGRALRELAGATRRSPNGTDPGGRTGHSPAPLQAQASSEATPETLQEQPSRLRQTQEAAANVDRELATRKELRDPVMRDAFEVAQGRQRQLGWSWRNEQ
jgi:hypothetical protein